MKKLISIICIFVATFLFIKTQDVYAEVSNHKYLTDLEYESMSVGWNNPKAFLINENEDGNLISLIVDGEKTFFLRGVFAHATSKVVYDLSEFKSFDTFSTYVGVDTSRASLGDGVKFSIYVSNDYNDKNKWILKYQSGVLKGNTESENIEVKISGYKYLILYAHQNSNNSSDHAVYADPIIYDSKNYNKEENMGVDFIKSVDEYTKELNEYTEEEILKDESLKLKLLQRTLVKRVGYSLIKAFVNASLENREFLEWLFTNEEILEEYLLGGEPEGGSYYKALDVFSKLYQKHKKDIDNDVYRKTMMAISLVYATDVNFWQTAEKPVTPVRTPSDALDRYEVIKKLYTDGYEYDNIKTHFEKKLYKSLQVEEMRWVVNNRISDIEIAWLNWYTQKTKAGLTDYNKDGYTNPYTYIYYASGWNYEDAEYYKKESNYCAYGNNLNKLNSPGYKRGNNCNDKYGLKHFGLETREDSPLRLWTIWEEDGVCGSLAGTGSNIEMSYGKPSTLVSQPGHAAYFVSKRIDNEDGTHSTEWQIGNAAAGWDKSFKGERMLLGWGNRDTSWVNDNNGSYLIVSQRAVDNFKDYKKAFMYNLIADLKTSIDDKTRIYNKALKVQSYNISSWYGLIKTYLEDEEKTSKDYYELSQRIMVDLEEFPLPMNDLLNIFKDKIKDEIVLFNNNLSGLLKSLTTEEKSKRYLQKDAVKQIANYLLGINEDLEVAKFSFDGENANKLMLNGIYKEESMPFEYTLNYEYDAEHKKVSSETNWYRVTDNTEVDLTEKLGKISKDKDIVIHILKDENRDDPNNLYFIDITKAKEPTNLYANNLERKVIGTTDVMEWKTEDSKSWTKFSEKEPTIDKNGITTVLVRTASNKTQLASDKLEFIFEEDTSNITKSYIPVSRLTAKASSQQNTTTEAAERAIDGNKYTYWHNRWDGKDEERYIEIEIDEPAYISMIDYMPRQDSGTNGIITKAKIEYSMDGENWIKVTDSLIWKNDKTTKTYELKESVQAKYIRITALESNGKFASAAMINLYEDRSKLINNIENAEIEYQKEGYVYNGNVHTPKVVVTDNDKTLEENVDYNIEYKNNVKSGTAKIEITGVGKYEGTLIETFKISKAERPSILPEESVITKASTLKEVSIPEGWSWSKPQTKLTEGKKVKVEAVYHNKEDYKDYKVDVLVERKKEQKTVDVVKEQNNKENEKVSQTKNNSVTTNKTKGKDSTKIENTNSDKTSKKSNKTLKEEKSNNKMIITIFFVILACALIIISTRLIKKYNN